MPLLLNSLPRNLQGGPPGGVPRQDPHGPGGQAGAGHAGPVAAAVADPGGAVAAGADHAGYRRRRCRTRRLRRRCHRCRPRPRRCRRRCRPRRGRCRRRRCRPRRSGVDAAGAGHASAVAIGAGEAGHALAALPAPRPNTPVPLGPPPVPNTPVPSSGPPVPCTPSPMPLPLPATLMPLPPASAYTPRILAVPVNPERALAAGVGIRSMPHSLLPVVNTAVRLVVPALSSPCTTGNPSAAWRRGGSAQGLRGDWPPAPPPRRSKAPASTCSPAPSPLSAVRCVRTHRKPP